MKGILTGLIGTTCFLFACREKERVSALLPDLFLTDSVTVMYYHTPGNPRFFNMMKVYDTAQILLLARAANEKTIPAKDTCTTEGKIYFYGRRDAVETVYFSRYAGCMTLSFIKTGVKYFTLMNDEIKRKLDEWQTQAREPE